MLLNVNFSYKNVFYFRCFYIEEVIIPFINYKMFQNIYLKVYK